MESLRGDMRHPQLIMIIMIPIQCNYYIFVKAQVQVHWIVLDFVYPTCACGFNIHITFIVWSVFYLNFPLIYLAALLYHFLKLRVAYKGPAVMRAGQGIQTSNLPEMVQTRNLLVRKCLLDVHQKCSYMCK